MIWIFDYIETKKKWNTLKRYGNVVVWEGKHTFSYTKYIQRPLYMDLNIKEGLVKLKKIQKIKSCASKPAGLYRGWGTLESYESFINKYLSNVLFCKKDFLIHKKESFPSQSMCHCGWPKRNISIMDLFKKDKENLVFDCDHIIRNDNIKLQEVKELLGKGWIQYGINFLIYMNKIK